MPLAAYSYLNPPYSSAGSGVNNHPAPPLADGIDYFPPGPYPCGYPAHYATPAPPYCCPYNADHRLHHSGALPQSIPHPQYPHLQYCPGLPFCSLPPDGLPAYSIAAPYNVDGRGAHGKPPHGPAFAFDSFPNHRSPQLFYPPVPAMPLWRPDERPSCNENADTEVKAGGQGHVPSHSLVPFHDKVQGATPNILYDGTAQWRGFPVIWKGNVPFGLVPLSNIDGEQNLFVPKKVYAQSAPEEPEKYASAYMDCPLPINHSPVMWKQQGLIPAATHEDVKVKLNAKDSLNDEDGKVKFNAKDSLIDEVSNSKPLPVVWDGKSPLVLLPAMNEAGKEFSNFMPFKLMPMTKEVGQESSKLQPQAVIPANVERQQDSDKPLTKNALVTALSEDEKKPRELEKRKASMPKNEGPIKVIPVVQLPAIDPSTRKEVSVQKEPPNDVGQEQAGIDHTHAKPLAGQQVGKVASHSKPVPKQNAKGPLKDPPVAKKGFPAIKLVPLTDAKRCKSPRKNATAAQKKLAVQGTQGVEPVEDGCHAGVPILSKDASLHEKDSGSNGADVKVVYSENSDGKAASEGASLKDIECKPVSSLNADGKATEEPLSSKDVEQNSTDIKVLPVASMGAADGLCDGKRSQAPWASDLEKLMSRDSAAKCIQAVYRGYCVRRSQPLSQLKIIKEVQVNMPSILEQLHSKAEALTEVMERRKLSESVMALLLKLDTVQGRLPYVREQRKSVAKELSRVLETLDNIEQEEAPLFTPEAVNELVMEQEEAFLSTPKTVNDAAKGQEEMSLQSQENTSTPKAVTAGEVDCSAKETMDKEMIVDEAANLTGAARNACTREECEGVAVFESNESEMESLSFDDSTWKEKVEAGSESGASELPPAVLLVESMDDDSKVDQETTVALDPCGSMKERIDLCESVTEQRIQCDPENKQEEERNKVADIEEGVTTFCEAAFSNADAVTPTCLISDAGRDQKICNQDEAGAVVRSLPTEVEERHEHANLESDYFDNAMHIADMRQSEQLDERVKEKPGDADEVVEELKEDAVVPRSSMEMMGEEKIEEHIEPRLGGHDFEGSVQSQQLDVAIAEESNEEEEVLRLSPDELCAHRSNSAEVLLENKSVEQLSLPEEVRAHLSNSAEVLHEEKCMEKLSIPEDLIEGEATIDGLELSFKDISTASEVLVEESRLDPLGSIEYLSKMGLKEGGETATAQQTLLDIVGVGEDAPAQQNLQDNSHEEYGVTKMDEDDVTPTKMDEEVDRNQLMMERSRLPLEEIVVDSCKHDAGIEGNLFAEESGPKVLLNAMDKREDRVSAKLEEGDMQKHCFEKLADESKNLLAVVEKLTQWNQKQANLITQLSERMSRLEEARNVPKHPVHSRKGRNRRRKITVNI